MNYCLSLGLEKDENYTTTSGTQKPTIYLNKESTQRYDGLDENSYLAYFFDFFLCLFSFCFSSFGFLAQLRQRWLEGTQYPVLDLLRRPTLWNGFPHSQHARWNFGHAEHLIHTSLPGQDCQVC